MLMHADQEKKINATLHVILTADQKFFINNIDKYAKYFNTDDYNDGGAGISWNIPALLELDYGHLMLIAREVIAYNNKKHNSIRGRINNLIKKYLLDKDKTSS